MGSHLIHTDSLPTTPEAFSHVFIHGAWDGELSFQEPMITVDYFNSLKTAHSNSTENCFDIPQPDEYPDNKSYPRQYCISYDRNLNRFEVSLINFYGGTPAPPANNSPTSHPLAYWPIIILLLLLFI